MMHSVRNAFAALLFVAACHAQSPTPRLTGIAHIAIRVADLDRARAFYEQLGYVQPFVQTDKDGKVTESFVKLNDRQYLELYPVDSAHADAGFLHVCFEAQDLPGLYPVYTANGVVAPPVRKAGAGNMLLAWKGPEGQTEEITEYLPGSKHSNDVGQHLGASRVSTQLIGAVVPMQDAPAAAQYFVNKMGFTQDGMHEGAIVTSPPGVRDAFYGFLLASSSEKLVMIFHVDSLKQAEHQLKALHVVATAQKSRVLVHDPDGNTLVFTAESVRKR